MVFRVSHYSYNPLAELIQSIFDMADGSAGEIIDILQCGERRNLTDDSGKQSRWLFGVVPVQHELPHKLGEIRFDTLSGLCKRDESRFPVLLIQSVRNFQCIRNRHSLRITWARHLFLARCLVR